MQRSAQKLNALFQISQRISDNFELQDLLDFIIGRAVKVLQGSTGSLMLIENPSQRLVMRSVIGLRADVIRTMKLRVGEGITGQCALHGQPLLVNDVIRDPNYIEAVPGTLSELAVPLRYQGRVFGVVNIDSSRLHGFTKQDLKLLTTFAAWASMAIRLKLVEG